MTKAVSMYEMMDVGLDKDLASRKYLDCVLQIRQVCKDKNITEDEMDLLLKKVSEHAETDDSEEGVRFMRFWLIALCEESISHVDTWHNRDSHQAMEQVGRLWALLSAGCSFRVLRGEHLDPYSSSDDNTYWIEVYDIPGFDYMNSGGPKARGKFYLPTARRLLDGTGTELHGGEMPSTKPPGLKTRLRERVLDRINNNGFNAAYREVQRAYQHDEITADTALSLILEVETARNAYQNTK